MAKVGVLAATVLVAGAAVSSCAAPDFQYASEPSTSPGVGTVYFKVPHAWTEFPAAQITAAQAGWDQDTTTQQVLDATLWQSAYDAASAPSLEHVLGTGTTDDPTVYVTARGVYQSESASLTPAALRDLVVPVSTLGSRVSLTVDDTIAQGSAKGVHLVYSYSPGAGAPDQTIDQTAYLSDGDDAIYLMVVRCSTTCYDRHRDEIGSVTSSFTIREDLHG